MSYPKLTDYSESELIRCLSAVAGEVELLRATRSERTRLGFALLLGSYRLLGFPPDKSAFTASVVDAVARALRVEPGLWEGYLWRGKTWRNHLRRIREHEGTRRYEEDDSPRVVACLVERGNVLVTRRGFLLGAQAVCREYRLELPSELVLRRLANSGRRKFFERIYVEISSRLKPETITRLESCLKLDEAIGTSRYEWMRSSPGKLGLKTLLREVEKLQYLRGFGVSEEYFATTGEEVLDVLAKRARSEDASRSAAHPAPVRNALFAAHVVDQTRRTTDRVVQTFISLSLRMERKAKRAVQDVVAGNAKAVFNSRMLLEKIAKVVTSKPDGNFRDDLFTLVPPTVFKKVLKGPALKADSFEAARLVELRHKYSRHYRRMMKPVLDTLTFGADNPAREALLEGLDLVHRYIGSKCIYYPTSESIPRDLLTGRWADLVVDGSSGAGERFKRHAFEACVLGKLARALKCKEVWVEGAYRYRDPAADLPQNWERDRAGYYEALNLPLDVENFASPIRQQLEEALARLAEHVVTGEDVRVHPARRGAKPTFHVPPLKKRAERAVLHELRRAVSDKWGIIDLLDILLEADRQVDFSQFFTTSGERQGLTREQIRERLLLVVFALATNLGLRRVWAAAQPNCSYAGLRYFRDRYVTETALRDACIALVNRILALRDPRIWGEGTMCASDGKHIGAWEQNLSAARIPKYDRPGIMAYWHVDKNSLCIRAQHRRPSSSEATAVLEGLTRHDTEMRVESNAADSHGQSEVAFAFASMLGFELRPRLKRIKHERLFVPGPLPDAVLNVLGGVLGREIRWDLIDEQYDELVRHVVAVAERTGPVDSILQRFNHHNRSHPTYKAFVELGKAQKTIFLCNYLGDPALRREINEALNVVESWNAVIDFIFFGQQSELQTNDEEYQQLAVLALQLVQNAVILSNTVMLERVMMDGPTRDKLVEEDYRSLTPLFTEHINPYGVFNLNFAKPSFLVAA